MAWGAGDAGDSAIKAAFEEIVAPAAHRFAPDIILVRKGKAAASSGIAWGMILYNDQCCQSHFTVSAGTCAMANVIDIESAGATSIALLHFLPVPCSPIAVPEP